MRIRNLLVAAALALVQQANAAVIIDVIEIGGNVEATLSGSLDLNATLGFHSQNNSYDGYLASGGNIAFTAASNIDVYNMDGDWTPFGTGGFGSWDSSSGDAWAMFADPRLGVPAGYVSGDSLSSFATKFNSSFAALGFTPGSYVTTLTNGNITDTVTVNIGKIPAPGALALLGIAGIAGRRRRRKA